VRTLHLTSTPDNISQHKGCEEFHAIRTRDFLLHGADKGLLACAIRACEKRSRWEPLGFRRNRKFLGYWEHLLACGIQACEQQNRWGFVVLEGKEEIQGIQ
jgi:hypothetical protein